MASYDYSITDVEKVVKLDGKVKNVNVSRLTAPGENYLSLVLRVDFEIENNGHLKTISTVAKRLPLFERKKGFDFHGSAMRNEIKWYSEIAPLLKDYAKGLGFEIDFFPEHYGSRLSLDSSKKEADSDSVLLMENLIPQGYQNDDRYIGSDFITSKAILRSLALFHAIPIVMKMKNPELFKVLKDFLDQSKPKPPEGGPPGHGGPSEPGGPRGPGGPPGSDGRKKHPPGPHPGGKSPEEILYEGLIHIPEIVPYLPKIKILFDKPKGPDSFHKVTKEPWNTIVHNDFWVNNIMVNHKYEKPLVKIVDFQMNTYGSFGKDLVFFLLSSVRNDVIKESMDDLLKYYYDEFTSILRKVDVDFELSYKYYLEEVRSAAAESEVGHAMSFSPVIFGEKGTGIDAVFVEFSPFEHMPDMIKNMNQYQKDKLVVMAAEAEKRNWM